MFFGRLTYPDHFLKLKIPGLKVHELWDFIFLSENANSSVDNIILNIFFKPKNVSFF